MAAAAAFTLSSFPSLLDSAIVSSSLFTSTISSTALPSGITPPYAAINSTDQSGLIAILTAFALGLVLLSIAIRVYARHNFEGYRVDDWAFFGACTCAIIQASLVLRGLAFGLGRLLKAISTKHTVAIQKLTYTSTLLYLLTLFLSKSSTSFLLLYLTPSRTHHRVIWSGIAAEAIWFTTSIILEAVRCNTGQPWKDALGGSGGDCGNLFARWAYISIFDCLIEVNLVATAIYIVWGLQMEFRSKLVVVGAFACRIPNIPATLLRLLFLHNSLSPSTSSATLHLWATRVISTTQISIGLSIALSIVPYLKPFITAYEMPASSAYSGRSRSRSGGSSGWNFKLSALRTGTSKGTTQTTNRGDDQEDENTPSGPRLIPLRHVNPSPPNPRNRSRSRSNNGSGPASTVHKPPFLLDRLRLRPEQTRYSARATAAGKKPRDASDVEGERGDEDLGEGSEDSTGLIIKKGVEFGVRFEREGEESLDRRSSGHESGEREQEIFESVEGEGVGEIGEGSATQERGGEGRREEHARMDTMGIDTIADEGGGEGSKSVRVREDV